MDKYISTNALIEELKRHDFLPVIVKQAIDAVPAADVVEVVRCEDCRWAKKVEEYEPKYQCVNICRYGCTQWLDSNDFCSYGERSNNELGKR